MARCAHAFDRCGRENPARRDIGHAHDVACHWDHTTAAPLTAAEASA